MNLNIQISVIFVYKKISRDTKYEQKYKNEETPETLPEENFQ